MCVFSLTCLHVCVCFCVHVCVCVCVWEREFFKMVPLCSPGYPRSLWSSCLCLMNTMIIVLSTTSYDLALDEDLFSMHRRDISILKVYKYSLQYFIDFKSNCMLKSLKNHNQIYASWQVVHKLMMIHLFWLLLFSYFFFCTPRTSCTDHNKISRIP